MAFELDGDTLQQAQAHQLGRATIGVYAMCGLVSDQQFDGPDGQVPIHALLVWDPKRHHAAKLVAAGWWVEATTEHGGRTYRFTSAGIGRFSAAPRRQVPRAVREAVYERDGHACVDCGAAEDLTLDHVWPYSMGGTDEPENLQTRCRSCNSTKGARV